MKRPYLNREQRFEIELNTLSGAIAMLDLSIKKALRDEYKNNGLISMKAAERNITRLMNLKIFGRDSKRKWYDVF